MEPAIRGLVLDSSVLVAAERAKLTTPDVLRNIRAMTVAELAHGIYRANSPECRQRRRHFVDELKAHIPVHPVTRPQLKSSLASVESKRLKESTFPSSI